MALMLLMLLLLPLLLPSVPCAIADMMAAYRNL
jgi:hypothetical protein